ncbi:MAG: tryptophan synthase subunit alpha [archaeon]|nr:tryptophan synthase subunit alpha [archaeon]
MSRIKNMFKAKKAFIPFTVLGDPDFDTSKDIIKAMIDSGADMLELGFPYSDPIADGPTIQLADKRALDAGATTNRAFRLIKEIRNYSSIPISLLVYSNLIYKRGIEKFYKDAEQSGVDGVLVADIPFEESEEYTQAAKKHNISPVFLVAQTTTLRRLKQILKCAGGYLYLVSVLGVTGKRTTVEDATIELIKRTKMETNIPLAVGFGVSSPEHVKTLVSSGADGAIVGSAIIQIIERNLSNKKKMIKEIGAFVKEMKSALTMRN